MKEVWPDSEIRIVMRVRITKNLTGSIDGIQLSRLAMGNVYDVNTSLACYLLSEGVAEPANHDQASGAVPAVKRTVERSTETRTKRVTFPRSLAAERARRSRAGKKRQH